MAEHQDFSKNAVKVYYYKYNSTLGNKYAVYRHI